MRNRIANDVSVSNTCLFSQDFLYCFRGCVYESGYLYNGIIHKVYRIIEMKVNFDDLHLFIHSISVSNIIVIFVIE